MYPLIKDQQQQQSFKMNNNIISSFQDQLNIHTGEIVRALAEKFEFSETEALKFLESAQSTQSLIDPTDPTDPTQ